MIASRHSDRGTAYRRRASSYLFFLGTAMAVTVIGLSALTAVRIQRVDAVATNELTAARFYAQSAIDHAFTLINSDASWRTNLGIGVWLDGVALGQGSYRVEAAFQDDGDGNPANDNVTLTGTGIVGDRVTYKIEVTLLASSDGVSISPGSFRRVIN